MFRFRLLFSILSIWILQSCKTYQLSNAEPVSVTKNSVENRYFDNPKTDYLYKSQIEIYGNEMSGILIIKKINETAHRIALTSDFGNKMMDFELSDSEFKVNYIIPDLDKKMVLKILEKDFRLLLKKNYSVKKTFSNSISNIYQSQDGKEAFYLTFDKNSDLLSQLIYVRKGKEKINFNYVAKTPIFADEIELIHHDIKLKIKLFQITE